MKIIVCILTFALLFTAPMRGPSQGFINLNFESENISGNAPMPLSTNIINGWEIGDELYLAYNDIALDAAAVDVFNTNCVIPAIQGKYSVYLQGGSQYTYPPHNGASIFQTGQIPNWAKSISYWGGALQSTFNGQALAFNAIGSGTGYTIWQADISAYTGQTGSLAFTAPWQTYGLLDNIRFSFNPVPEPRVLSLVGLGALAFGWRWWQRIGGTD